MIFIGTGVYVHLHANTAYRVQVHLFVFTKDSTMTKCPNSLHASVVSK